MVHGGMSRWDARLRIPEEFGKDAVALYPAAGGRRTYAAADLGVTAESLRDVGPQGKRVPGTARTPQGWREST
ncbi:hypothetical protein GCM10010306_092550 [Streptomyces umbrinus]|nr:hypothetical protein GCM10010306_092550 [Streptomyces umbrinus]